MDDVRLIDLGLCSYTKSQTLYHAVADAMRPTDPNTIILCRPQRPYVCIGRHQELDREVDESACRRLGLPILRREVGGGAVYLDRNQVFFQLVWRPREVPARIHAAFEHFAQAPVDCYQRLGVTGAHFAPVNDLQVDGRKIGGLGAASIGHGFVFVGSIILDFNARAAASVLRIADEKMRDKVAGAIDTYVSSLRKELGHPVRPQTVRRQLIASFEQTLGTRLVPDRLDQRELASYQKWVPRMRDRTWIDEVGLGGQRRKPLRITGQVYLGHGDHKAPGGLVRVTLVVAGDTVVESLVSGDFYAIGDAPAQLEAALLGPASAQGLAERVAAVWDRLEAPGVAPDHVVRAATDALRLATEALAAGRPTG
ncbi:MAG TPA: biotin/lipoate A/B protein ligase family protein [Candidatus Dormibacteraeota bacterium]|nr:biotin/lipoate A/B protein ligase family protein [Candidatus Dormibacteraeota bacterium]